MTHQVPLIPKPFIMRRLHSLMGLWIVLFLMQHLLVNSQAALFIGDDGFGFIKGVNDIHSLPYLPVIEALLLGVPFLLHGWLGVKYLFTGKSNAFPSNGSNPSLPEYPRNHAYTWQRITSWILLFAIIGHVVQMRFLEYPSSAKVGTDTFYMVRLEADNGLAPLSLRLGFDLLAPEQIQAIKTETPFTNPPSAEKNVVEQGKREWENWLAALEKRPLHGGQVLAVSQDFGTAVLLMVRDTFKMPIMIALYTVFVLAACFHAFNGLWTFMITWGVTLSANSQRWMRKIATGLMVLITCLGLAAIWGTYWINLFN